MKLNTLDRATKLYNRIQELDKQIVEVEKYAHRLANHTLEVTVHFSIPNTEPEKVTFDEDGSIRAYGQSPLKNLIQEMQAFRWPTYSTDGVVKGTQEQMNFTITETMALQMVGIVIQQKANMRRALINELKGLGYEI